MVERARIIMSCNGCRVLRKGCNESCALRPCLEWIERPEAQGYATLFLAKFYGRAGLLEFITAVPLSQRTALFQSLLYEACGRTVNPVYGAVGLLWSGKWHICQEAVETILNGGNLLTNVMCSHDTIFHSSGVSNPNSIAHLGSISGGSHSNLTSRASQSHLFKVPPTSLHAQSCLMPNIACKPSILAPSIQTLEEQVSFNYSHKKLKINSDKLDSRSFIFQSRPREAIIACNFTTNTKQHQNIITSCSSHTTIRHSEVPCGKIIHHDMDKCSSNTTNEEHLALTLTTSKNRGEPIKRKEDVVNERDSSPSEGSIVTSLGSRLFPSTSCHHLSLPPSCRSRQDMKLLNLLV